jgi:DNA-binding ferritin-like protein
MNPIVAKFVSTILSSRTQAHIFHWQTQDDSSFAKHKALNEYYDEIVELIDELVEALQGKYGIITGYQSPSNFREDDNPVIYFMALSKYVDASRTLMPEDSYIQNLIDEIYQLIETTLYKLQYLH